MGLTMVLSGVISALLITATVQGCDTAKPFFSVLFKSNQDSNLKLALFLGFSWVFPGFFLGFSWVS